MTKDELLEIIREELDNIMAEWDTKNPDDDPSPRWNKADQDAVDKQRANLFKKQMAKQSMMAQKVKYKNPDGTEGEATVKTLLGYDKDHPGRKAAARMYAQYMAKNKEENTISEHSAELDERTVASREPPRKMSKDQVSKRDGIGKKLMKNKRALRYFKDKFGDDWKSYLWAASTNKAIDGKKKGKK
jgi:hypothetical protein